MAGFFDFKGTILGGPAGDGAQPVPTIHVHPLYYKTGHLTEEEFRESRFIGLKRFFLNLLGYSTLYSAMEVGDAPKHAKGDSSVVTVFGRRTVEGGIQPKPGIQWFNYRPRPIPQAPGGPAPAGAHFPGYALGYRSNSLRPAYSFA